MTKPLRVKGVIFDVDGTIADSVGTFYEVALEVLHLAGVPAAPKEHVYELMRVGDDNPLVKLFPPDYPDLETTLKRIIDESSPGPLVVPGTYVRMDATISLRNRGGSRQY